MERGRMETMGEGDDDGDELAMEPQPVRESTEQTQSCQ